MPIPAILGNPGTDTIERSCCSLSLRFLRLRGQDFVPSHLPGQEAVYGHAEHMRQKHQLEIGDPADTQLDAGNDVAGNIPAGQLTLRRQYRLRPSPARAQDANLGPTTLRGFLVGPVTSCGLPHLTVPRFPTQTVWYSTRSEHNCAGRFSVLPTLRPASYLNSGNSLARRLQPLSPS